jgi:hypothetical protein
MTTISWTKAFANVARGLVLAAGLACLATLAGCGGGGDFATSPVRGKVTFKGEPVKAGTLNFRPLAGEGNTKSMPGKSAVGTINADGTYTLATYKPGDGAVVGKHEVTFTPFLDVDEELASKATREKPYVAPPSPYAGLVPKEKEVTVKSGKNEIDIELVPPSGAASR